MIDLSAIEDLGRSGATSIFDYIERTADIIPEGIRWATPSPQKGLHYNSNVYNGVAGISLFLTDYAHVTGSEHALELAQGAVRWCSLPERNGYTRGLYTGKTGIGLACLHLWRITHDSGLLDHCAVFAENILNADPGPVTDMLGGAAGNGLFLLRLWEASRHERYLRGALRNGSWLHDNAKRDASGVSWPTVVNGTDPRRFLGFAHGVAGIAYFFLLLHEVQPEGGWADLAREALATLSRQAKPLHDGLNWPQILNEEEALECQWCHGAPGVGLSFAKAYEVLGAPDFRAIAEAAGEATFAAGDQRRNPVQCHGLSGNAELFIELYRITKRPLWLERAQTFAQHAFAYRTTGPAGDVWQGHLAGQDSPDFMGGAAGVGHFFLRLWKPNLLRMPLA